MIQPSSREHRLRLDAIEVVFRWTGDRWAHRVIIDGGRQASIWDTVEGDASETWPASPALTELATVPGTGAIVGVGRAGRSHFSVCFQPASSGDDASRFDELLVEAACRIHEPPAWLGSVYVDAVGNHLRFAAPIAEATAEAPLPRTIGWSYRIGRRGLRPSAATATVPAAG